MILLSDRKIQDYISLFTKYEKNSNNSIQLI